MVRRNCLYDRAKGFLFSRIQKRRPTDSMVNSRLYALQHVLKHRAVLSKIVQDSAQTGRIWSAKRIAICSCQVSYRPKVFFDSFLCTIFLRRLRIKHHARSTAFPLSSLASSYLN